MASAVAWGTGDFAGGLATKSVNVFVTILASQLLGLAASAAMLTLTAEPLPAPPALAWAAAAGVSGVGALFCFYIALARGTMGLVAPLTGLVAAAVPAIVAIVSGERVEPVRLVGIVLALVAVVVISLPADLRWTAPHRRRRARGEDETGLTPARGRSPRDLRELLLVLVAGLGFAGFFLGMDGAAAAGGATWWPITVVRIAGLTLVVSFAVIVLALRGRRSGDSGGAMGRVGVSGGATLGVVPLVALAGIGDTAGNLFFVLANAETSLAVAVVLSSLYPVITALLAAVVLRERLTRHQVLGVAVAAAGIALIAAGNRA